MNWYAKAGAALGGWPRTYMCFDTETNGVDVRGRTLPVEFGWCLVIDGVAADTGSVILDWTEPGLGIDLGWLDRTLEETRRAMESRGNAYPFTLDYLQQRGEFPSTALCHIALMLADAQELNAPFVVHKGYDFDCPLLARVLAEHTLHRINFDPEQIIDTMFLEKARRLNRPLPLPGCRGAWYEGLRAGRAKCALAGACNETYDLGIDPHRAHSAGYDAFMTHRLLERMRERAITTAGVA